MKIIKLTIILTCIFCINLSGQKYKFFVSPGGNDKNDGTITRPFATIDKVQHLIRKIKKRYKIKDTITVFFREGVYRLRQGIVFNDEDGGTDKYPIFYRSYNREKVVISGAIHIKNYSPLSKDHFLYKKSPLVGNKLIEIDLQEAGLTRYDIQHLLYTGRNVSRKSHIFRELYFNGKPMNLSRWPENEYSEFIDVITETSSSGEKIGIVYQDLQISTWKNSSNILLHGYWKHLWDESYEYVSEIDILNKVIWLRPPYNYFNFEKNRPFAAFNVITEIDKPGEWAYNYGKGKLYLYPSEDLSNAIIELSICEDPLITLKNTEHIIFRDINFEMSANDGVRISNCKNILIENCNIHGCAADGIKIFGGKNNTIYSCDIHGMGRGGIYVSGGNRKTLEGSGHLIDNCHIHNLSRIDRTYTPGVWVEGVGTTIKHCEIHDIPSSAMNINGNNHTIEYNELYNVVTESDDQGAIDMYGNPTYRGNLFRYNYIHDIGPNGKDKLKANCGRAGIRLDDAISGNIIYGNIFRNCSLGNMGAVQINGGKDNLIINNIIYQCSIGISFNSWNYERWIKQTNKYLEFFNHHKELYISHYPELSYFDGDLNKNTIVENIFLQCGKTIRNKPKAVIFNNNIEIKEYNNNNFSEKDKYSLKDLSDHLKDIHFKLIPFDKVGLRNK